jgi:hypothetical protein
MAQLEFLQAAIEYDPTAVDEHEIGEDVLDLQPDGSSRRW